MKLYLAIFLILCAIPGFSQTGDTIRTEVPPPKITQDTIRIPFDTNYIKSAYRLSTTSETFGVSNWIWNDKRNLGEILDQRPGYMVNFIDNGGHNNIHFNGSGDKIIGFYKDGIQINDFFTGGFDIENISINEIDTIEELSSISSYLYGINSSAKAVNIITKDVFQPELFSQLRFTQDRYGSENAEVYFSQSLSRKFNWQIGANKHSITGRYANSEFDVWRARFRTNWFISPKANVRFNFNYANIQRGLNEGLIFSTEDTLRNPELAKVVNPDAYEKLTNFFYDISFNGRFLKDKNSLTKLRLYSQNSLREYRDEEGGTNSNGIVKTKNFHSILYGIDLKQNFNFTLAKNIKTDLTIGGNAYFNLYDFDIANINIPIPQQYITSKFTENYYTAFSKIDVFYKDLFLSLSGKYSNLLDNESYEGGVEAEYTLFKNKDFGFTLFAGINSTKLGVGNYYFKGYNPLDTNTDRQFLYSNYNYYYKQAGVKVNYKNLRIKLYQYKKSNDGTIKLDNGNYEISFNSQYFDAYTAINYNNVELATNRPRFYIKSDFNYHNFFFNNNLNLKIGVNVKYINKLRTAGYDEYENIMYVQTGGNDSLVITDLFNMDFYIGARIGSANIAFTFANILDNFNYNTFLYPWDDRGGAFNSLSRFSITWDFLD